MFNNKVVTKLANENLKYTRAQYREKLQLDLKHERPPMISEKEWKALIEYAMLAANPFFSRLLSKAAYTPCGILINLCRIVLMDMCLVFATITIRSRLSFHNCKCENTYFVDYTVVAFLICWLILDHWFIV
jgi:hypothetical protein